MKPPPHDGRWVWVSLPRATFAIIVQNGRVVDAAPYARSIIRIGWDEHRAAAALIKAGAEFQALPDDGEN